MNRIKSIAIIEVDYHQEVLRSLIEILEPLNCKIYVFSLERIWKRAAIKTKLKKTEVYLAKNRREIKKLITNNLEIINNTELIIFNTLASKFRFFASIQYNPPVLLRVHNVNTYLNFSWKNLDFKLSPFYIWKDTSYIFRRVIGSFELFYRKKFIQNRIDYFSFPEKSVAQYAIKNGFVQEERVIDFIPFVYSNTETIKVVEKDFVSITIIGLVDKRKKDYNEVYEAFKSLVPQLKSKVVLNFLGRPVGIKGKAILGTFKKLENSNFRVNTYNAFVPLDEFKRVTENTDFLLIPVTQFYHFSIFREIAGKTKVSGNINDAIVSGKPALIPSFYELEKGIKPMFVTYSGSEELIHRLSDWISTRSFLEIDTKKILEKRSFKEVSGQVGASLQRIVKEKSNRK